MNTEEKQELLKKFEDFFNLKGDYSISRNKVYEILDIDPLSLFLEKEQEIVKQYKCLNIEDTKFFMSKNEWYRTEYYWEIDYHPYPTINIKPGYNDELNMCVITAGDIIDALPETYKGGRLKHWGLAVNTVNTKKYFVNYMQDDKPLFKQRPTETLVRQAFLLYKDLIKLNAI